MATVTVPILSLAKPFEDLTIADIREILSETDNPTVMNDILDRLEGIYQTCIASYRETNH